MSKHRAITSILLALILTSSAFFVILSYDGERGTVLGQVGTSVGGILLDNTVWTPNGSPYNFVNDVIVAQNSTLTITPGTVVNIGLSAFIINGTLNARGNSDNRIVFEAQNRTARSWPPRIFFNDSSTPWNENTGTGCIIDYAQINVPNWQYETIMGAYPKISNNIIYNYGGDAAAVRINGLVENNTIMGGYRGIVAQFNEKILSNTIEGATAGISCGYMSTDPIYHPTIIGNVLTNNYVGIDDYGCAPYIANNTITANQFGFYFTSYTFYGNAIPDGIISNNIDNNNYNVLIGFTDSQKTINMANNWWGTTESAKIADSIYDNTTNSNLNKVNYIPFLTQPNPLAPSNSSTTIPSPSPTPISTAPATPAPTSTPLPFPSPTLALSCASTTSYSTLNVEISGNLTDNGNNIPSVPIFMMYSVTG
ncbi:MAG TPA: hypothetical protein VLU95_05040, partial [Candidatus Acidoferrum sp.]|nr:hypothetical protein [Candidatus Acidoferrum sp.]